MESGIVPIPSDTAGPAFPCPLPPLPLRDAADGVTGCGERETETALQILLLFVLLLFLLVKEKCEKCWVAPRGVSDLPPL